MEIAGRSVGIFGISWGLPGCCLVPLPHPVGGSRCSGSPGKGINHCPCGSRAGVRLPWAPRHPARRAGAVSHADALLRDLGRLRGKSHFTGGDTVWATFWGMLGPPGTGTCISCCSMSRALVIKQKSSSAAGCRIGRGENEELPPLCICSYPSPPGQAGCDLCCVSLPLGFLSHCGVSLFLA